MPCRIKLRHAPQPTLDPAPAAPQIPRTPMSPLAPLRLTTSLLLRCHKKKEGKKKGTCVVSGLDPSSPLAKTPSTPRGAICIGMMMAGMSGVAARCGLLVCRGVRGGPSPPSHIHTSLGGPLQPLLSRRTLAHAGAPSARFARFAPHHFIGRGIYTGGGASAPAMRGWPSMFTNSLQRFGRNRRVILFGKTPRLNITISRVGR